MQPDPLSNDNPSIVSLVVADLAVREAKGIETYGTTLQAHNGRDALWDLYEEILDAACYIRQEMEERKSANAGDVRISCQCGDVTWTTPDTPAVIAGDFIHYAERPCAYISTFGDEVAFCARCSSPLRQVDEWTWVHFDKDSTWEECLEAEGLDIVVTEPITREEVLEQVAEILDDQGVSLGEFMSASLEDIEDPELRDLWLMTHNVIMEEEEDI